MDTNYIPTIAIIVTLVTNVTTIWPKRYVAMPCPDGIFGCLVAHGRYEDDTNAKNRTIRMEVLRKRVAVIDKMEFVLETEALSMSDRYQALTWTDTTNPPPQAVGWWNLSNTTIVPGTLVISNDRISNPKQSTEDKR